jgi:hypothetical protein
VLSGLFFDANPQPVLRITGVTPSATGMMVRLQWTAVPGRYYRVQTREAATVGPWQSLPGIVQATDLTASYSYDAPSTQKTATYRVILVP